MIKNHGFKIALSFLWLSGLLFYTGLYIFGTTAIITCIGITIYTSVSITNNLN